MSDKIIISSPGLDTNNQAGGRMGLFLTQFAGEAMTAYRRKSVTLGRHIERTIENGKAADFPVLGRKTANYLFPGENLDDKRTAEQQTKRTIVIDGLLTSDCLIHDLDEAMQHFDVRGEYATQIGEALALARDGGLLAEIAKEVILNKENLPGLGKGAVLTASITGGMNGELEDMGLAIMKQLLDAKTAMSMNYVPTDGRVCYMLPVALNALIAAKDAINRLYGGVASIADANITRICGFDLVECPHLTQGGVTATNNGTPEGLVAGTGHIFPTAYKDKTAFLVAHRYTVGTLTLKSFAVEHARRAEYQADQVIGKYAMGHGGLRPEAAFMGVIETKA